MELQWNSIVLYSVPESDSRIGSLPAYDKKPPCGGSLGLGLFLLRGLASVVGRLLPAVKPA